MTQQWIEVITVVRSSIFSARDAQRSQQSLRDFTTVFYPLLHPLFRSVYSVGALGVMFSRRGLALSGGRGFLLPEVARNVCVLATVVPSRSFPGRSPTTRGNNSSEQ
jgi:hypothetical protein